MQIISLKNYQGAEGSKKVLIHSVLLILALSYIFYLSPEWSANNRFHIWAPALLAGIDVLAFYFFFLLINYFKKAKLPVLFLILLGSCTFLYYSGGINNARILNTVLKISEVPIWFSKRFIVAAIPRLALVMLTSLFYFALLNLDLFIAGFKRYLNMEAVINVAVIVFVFIYQSPPISDSDFFETLFIKGIVLVVFYTHTFKISPIIFKHKKHIQFIVWLVGMFIITMGILMVILFHINQIRYTYVEFRSFKNQFSVFYLILIVAALVYGFIRYIILNRFQKTETALGKTTSELLLLKSQVNPHFLFNTLNTLYATALEEDASITASATAKLANLVRYMQQDMQQEFIPLEREAGYISDYINIQKLRIASPFEVNTEFENLENTQISPGLLIPFVENAFKYGIDPGSSSNLNIKISVVDNRITFNCKNTCNPQQTTYYREKGFGIGIQNTRERLDLIYPKCYELDIQKTEEFFTVNLKIKTQ